MIDSFGSGRVCDAFREKLFECSVNRRERRSCERFPVISKRRYISAHEGPGQRLIARSEDVSERTKKKWRENIVRKAEILFESFEYLRPKERWKISGDRYERMIERAFFRIEKEREVRKSAERITHGPTVIKIFHDERNSSIRLEVVKRVTERHERMDAENPRNDGRSRGVKKRRFLSSHRREGPELDEALA